MSADDLRAWVEATAPGCSGVGDDVAGDGCKYFDCGAGRDTTRVYWRPDVMGEMWREGCTAADAKEAQHG